MYDVVVIGLGGVGSFALRALAKGLAGKGKKILGIERWNRLHDKGSSHGETRLFRRAYFEDAGYIPWIDFSIQEFEALEKENDGLSLLHKCGNLIIQEKPAETVDGGEAKAANYLQLAMDAAKEHGIDVDFLNQEQLKKRFPQFQYPKGTEYIGLLEPGAGFVRPEMAMSAALTEAEANEGVSVWELAKVVSLKELPPGNNDDTEGPCVELQVERNEHVTTIQSKTVLIAAGAWASQLIPSWARHMTVTRQVQGWVDVSQSKNPDMYQPNEFPTWILATSHYPLPFYGVPIASMTSTDTDGDIHSGKKYIKVAVHNDKDKIDDPTSNYSSPITEAEMSEYQRSVRVALDSAAWNDEPDLSNRLRVKTCMYTMTKDENFLIGVPDEFKSVYAIAGLSGHGFKMAPALGQMLADFALVGEEALNANWKPTRFCHPSRFDH